MLNDIYKQIYRSFILYIVPLPTMYNSQNEKKKQTIKDPLMIMIDFY